jgi:hypothetical protein
MPSATDALLDKLEGPGVATEMTPAASGVDLGELLLDVVRSRSLDIDIAGSVTDGSIERSIDTASTVSLTIHDPRRVLQRSDIWDYEIDINVNGFHFRLVHVNKSGNELTLTFEDRAVVWMRYHNKPLKISRAKMTRAEFIKHMVDEIKADNKAHQPLRFFSPQLHKKQPIKKPKKEKDRRKNREPGLHKKISIKDPTTHNELTKDQKSQLERVLDVGYHLDAPYILMVASMMVVWQESKADPKATNGSHVGLFQQDPRYWPGTRKAEPDATAFFQRGISVYKDFTSGPLRSGEALKPVELAEMIQHSGQGSLYQAWEPFARRIINEYNGGKGGKPDKSSTYQHKYAKSYQFTRGQPGGPKWENTWQAANRLAEEVRWRFFVVGNTVFYVTDNDLLKAKPVMVIDEDDDGIMDIDYDEDAGKRAGEATITCRAEKWFAHPGEVIHLKDTMGKAKGRWLVERITRPIFSETTTIELYRPHDPLLEPAHEINTVTKERKSRQPKGSGHVEIAPGANRPAMELNQIVIDFLEAVAANTSEQITIGTGTNHPRLTTTGNVSDHWDGHAADILVGGDARTNPDTGKKGDNIATAVVRTCGLKYSIARERAVSGDLNFGRDSTYSWRGHSIQVGWRTLEGGNHYNHVHVGVR